MMQERPNPPAPAAAPKVEPAYGIREASASSLSCAACGHEVAGGGPVGHRGDEPLCDSCLLEGSPQLGMVLALVAVSRAYAGEAPPRWAEPAGFAGGERVAVDPVGRRACEQSVAKVEPRCERIFSAISALQNPRNTPVCLWFCAWI